MVEGFVSIEGLNRYRQSPVAFLIPPTQTALREVVVVGERLLSIHCGRTLLQPQSQIARPKPKIKRLSAS